MTENKRIQNDYYMLIGKNKCGDYVFLDYAFKDGESFMGMTGTYFNFLTENEYEERKNDYIEGGNLLYLWKEAVQNGSTEESYEEWKEEVVENSDFDLILDDSYRYTSRLEHGLEIINKKEGTDFLSDYSDCIGGGRCFKKEMLEKDYREWTVENNFNKFKELYAIYEKPNDDKDTIDRAKKRLKELYAVGLFETDTAKESRENICNSAEYSEAFLKQFGPIDHENLSFNE